MIGEEAKNSTTKEWMATKGEILWKRERPSERLELQQRTNGESFNGEWMIGQKKRESHSEERRSRNAPTNK